jgi:hypothetical protein
MDGIALLTTLPLAGLGLKEEIEGLSSSMEDRASSNVLVQKLRFPAAAAASLFGRLVSLGKFSKGDESRRVGMGARMLLSVAGVGGLSSDSGLSSCLHGQLDLLSRLVRQRFTSLRTRATISFSFLVHQARLTSFFTTFRIFPSFNMAL